MKKQALIIEIEDLLISINNHFVDVENNIRIPNIELDVISSKVSKLHEKIAVFKFLNEQEVGFKNEKVDVGNQKLTKIEELKTIAFDVSPAINTPQKMAETIKPIEKMQEKIDPEIKPIEKIVEPIKVENTNPIQTTPIAQTTIVETILTPSNLVDIKKLMSINDRLLFQNQLFENIALDFNTFTDKINASVNFQDANFYFDTVLKQRNWQKDDETVFTLKRYIHKRYNG